MPGKIKGLLIDMDGVLYEGSHPVPGTVKAFKQLQKEKIPYRLLTNTTTQSRQSLRTKLKVMGFDVPEAYIFSAPFAASRFLQQKKVKNIYLFAQGTTSMDFKDFKITEIDPEYVVIGDLASDYTYDRINKAFRLILNGAKMLAMQKNRFWKTESGFTLDVGAFVALLEYGANQKAKLIGKPARAFYKLALADMGMKAENVAMIGDDVEVDIEGAQKVGCKAIQVKTGKYRPAFQKELKIKPDYLIDSFADIPVFLKHK